MLRRRSTAVQNKQGQAALQTGHISRRRDSVALTTKFNLITLSLATQ